MPRVTDDDPLELMEFMAKASFRIRNSLLTTNWSETLQEFTLYLEPKLHGRFRVMLGDESLVTDSMAQYIVYAEDCLDAQLIHDAFLALQRMGTTK